MSYGRQRMSEIKGDDGAFSSDFMKEMLDKPFTVLTPSDFEQLLSKEVEVKLTKLQRREIIRSVLSEQRIIVQDSGIEVIHPMSTGYNSVLQMILKDVGGRIHCPLCNSKHNLSCSRCRWEVQWF